MAYIVSTNIGLGGSNETTDDFTEIGSVNENVRKVWRNVHDRLTAIRHKWNIEPSILGVQEDGAYNFSFEPFFGQPVVTDYGVTVGSQGRGRRGVATYCRLDTYARVDPIDNTNEIATMTFDFYNGEGAMKKGAYVNFYRNQHAVHGRSVNDTIAALKATIKNLRINHNIRKIIIQGDMNDEGPISLGNGFREIIHRKLYHKANASTRKTKIDRVWANFDKCGILDVTETAENKENNESKELGHKTIVLWVGKKPAMPAKKKIKIIDFKSLKSEARGAQPNFEFQERDCMTTSQANIDLLIEDFMNVMNNFTKKATKSISMKNTTADKVFLNDMERDEDAILHGKKQSKVLYRSMTKLRKGLDNVSDSTKPSLEKLGGKLEKKLDKLNDADHETAKAVIDEMFDPETGNECKRWVDIEEFRKICLSTSNSGAKDSDGYSLKVTKVLLSNRAILRRYELIITKCLELGYFPTNWKHDHIHFIYKNKGSREDPANWRPITIASSFGKHFEKTISHLIAGIDDLNHDNHAYKSKRACMTAITAAQQAFLMDYLKSAGIDMSGKKIITSISLDDISGAFESVDHVIISYLFEKLFRKEKRFNIKGVILSYLDRDAKIVSDDTAETYDLATKALRSIPQGSILSPLLWRLFDGVFTRMYKNTFPAIQESNKDIIAITHIAYADDHMTIFSIIIEVNKSNDEIGHRLSWIFDLLRSLLKDATCTLGSDINPAKSESIVLEDLAQHIILTDKTDKDPSNKFKWLGYHLLINDDMMIEFNEAKIKETINTVNSFRTKAYSYTDSVGLRWRIYKVYISPFVELLLPLVIQAPSTGPRAKTIIHDLQHHSMCFALGLPFTANRREIEKFMGEKAVEEKAQRLATRMINVLDIKRPSLCLDDEIPCNRITRSGKRTWDKPVSKKDKQQFLIRLFISSDLLIEDTPKVQFETKKVKRWCRKMRKEIQEHVNKNQ